MSLKSAEKRNFPRLQIIEASICDLISNVNLIVARGVKYSKAYPSLVAIENLSAWLRVNTRYVEVRQGGSPHLFQHQLHVLVCVSRGR